MRPLRVAACLLLPLLVFVVFLRTVGNSTEALAIADAVPVVWLVAGALWKRRVEPAAAIAVVGFAVAVLLTIALGGSPRPLELHRAVFPGAAGLACLVSLGVGRPLLLVMTARVKGDRVRAAKQPPLDSRGARRALWVVTALIGVTLTVDAAAQVVLAFTVSASTFGVVAHIASWVIIGLGITIVVGYVQRLRLRLKEEDAPNSRQPHPASPGDRGTA
jgi:uncharacterized membrane protein YciS (DUF1049 family)